MSSTTACRKGLTAHAMRLRLELSIPDDQFAVVNVGSSFATKGKTFDPNHDTGVETRAFTSTSSAIRPPTLANGFKAWLGKVSASISWATA